MNNDAKVFLIALGMLLASLTTCSVADAVWRDPGNGVAIYPKEELPQRGNAAP